jgi:hypothetical protein
MYLQGTGLLMKSDFIGNSIGVCEKAYVTRVVIGTLMKASGIYLRIPFLKNEKIMVQLTYCMPVGILF